MKNITFEQSYASRYCNEYDILDNGKLIGYYIEHFHHPLTEEKLDNPVYEIYYDNAEDEEDFCASAVCDSLEEALQYADILV